MNNLIDPINDLEIIKTEIVLSDIDLIQKKLEKSKKKILSPKELDLLQSALKNLNEGEEITVQSDEDYKFFNTIGILSIKPKIIVCNVDEQSLATGNEYTNAIQQKFINEKIILICADIEDQLSSLDRNEKENFMKEIGLDKTGLNKLIKEGYDLLNLNTFLPLV